MEKLTAFISSRLASAGTVSDELAGILTTMIFNGDFPPNYMFPNETVFCKQLGVGRNSLRETYKILESTGLITRTKRGTFVNDRDTVIKNMPISLALRLTQNAKVLEYRRMIEVGIVAYAAERAPDENIKNMEMYINKTLENKFDPVERITNDYLFHLEISKSTQNDLFVTLMQPICDFMLDPATIEKSRDRIINNTENAVAHHRNILEAIKHKDKAESQKAMFAHMSDYGGYFLTLNPDKS